MDSTPILNAVTSQANPIVIVEKTSTFIPLILLTALLFTLYFSLDFLLSSFISKDSWSEIRCQPHILPIASFYGYDTMENFNYCMSTILSKKATKSFGPLYKIVEIIMGVMTTLVSNANSLQLQLATLTGGIFNIFKEFGQRISQFMFRIQLSAQRIKMLMNRVYGSMFAVIYMGMSAITAVNNLADSTVIKFVNFFCFDPSTKVIIKDKGIAPISCVQIGDIITDKYNRFSSKITTIHRFIGDGQPVVKLDDIIVSTNHYVQYKHKFIPAGEHPNAIKAGVWNGGCNKPFICFNTDNNLIPIDEYIFRDYDETHEGDIEYIKYVNNSLNGISSDNTDTVEYMKETQPGISENTQVKMQDGSFVPAKKIQLGDTVFSHSSSQSARIIGIIKYITPSICIVNNNRISPTTLIWNNKEWIRAHTLYKVDNTNEICYGFIVSPSSSLILENDVTIRDHIEVLSPFSEEPYADKINE
jgi:hypothetical protein